MLRLVAANPGPPDHDPAHASQCVASLLTLREVSPESPYGAAVEHASMHSLARASRVVSSTGVGDETEEHKRKQG